MRSGWRSRTSARPTSSWMSTPRTRSSSSSSGPVQAAYGRAQRTHAEFAERHGLPGRDFLPASAGAPSMGVKALLDSAVEAAAGADGALSALQDSMLPVEVGDAELRAGLEAVRMLLGDLRGRARELVRTLGR